MRLAMLLFLFIAGAVGRPALADTPGLQIVNFTAEWCPTCRVFDPALHTVLDEMNNPSIELLAIDLTHSRGGTRQQKDKMWGDFLQRMRDEGMPQIYYAYNQFPYTGYSVVVAADTKEPVVCMRGALRPLMIESVLLAARRQVATQSAGNRLLREHNCPAPFLAN